MEVIDSFLPDEVFSELLTYCENEFVVVNAGEKDFLVLPTPEWVNDYLRIDGYRCTLSFIRKAHSSFDTDWRIHADSIINSQPTHLARVLYIKSTSPSYTAFWEHSVYGRELPDVSHEEFDRLLVEDANDLSKWELLDKVESVTNRSLVYNARHFHSKYPNIIEGERIVLVVFYTKEI